MAEAPGGGRCLAKKLGKGDSVFPFPEAIRKIVYSRCIEPHSISSGSIVQKVGNPKSGS